MKDDLSGESLTAAVILVAVLFVAGLCRCDGPKAGPAYRRPSPVARDVAEQPRGWAR